MNRTPARIALGLAAAAAITLAAPLAASAHVTVNPNQAEPGGYSQLTFRVPNESDTAGTIRLEVALPTDTPFAYVSYQPVAGWTTTLVTSTLPEPVEVSGNELTEAVTSIVWEAQPGTEIAPGQFQVFPISVGPVPETGSIALAATQTYSDGEAVEWAGAPDADLPAPVLYIQDEPAGDSHGGGTHDSDSAEDEDEDGVTVTASEQAGTDGLARGLGIASLGLGAIAVVLAAFGLVGRRAKR